MRVGTIIGWVLALAMGGCSSSSSGGGGAPACAPTGTFTIGLNELSNTFCDAGRLPTTLSVTVNYGSDGSGTVNGQSCTAYCFSDAGFGSCASLGLPPVDPGICEVDLRCTGGNIEQVSFPTPVQGQPPNTNVLVNVNDDAGTGCFQYGN